MKTLIMMLICSAQLAWAGPIKIELIHEPFPDTPSLEELGSVMAMGSLMQQLGFGGDYEFYMEDHTLDDPYTGERWLQENGYLAGPDRIFALPETDIDIDFYSQYLPGETNEYIVEFTITPPGSPDGIYNETFPDGTSFEDAKAAINRLVARAIADGHFNVPEPSSLAIFLLALMGLSRYRKICW